MEGIAVDYFPNLIDPGSNEKTEFYSYISDDNEQDSCYSHSCMFSILKYIFDSLILVYVCQQCGKTPMVLPSNI